ncbi:hypothetical protein ABZ234_25515 [Nocardiopsis sp. NPDC006198]|uniref:hypothetical protein n=1 Tax=Nocardiopsis sp. NPDC006198 TaxID=3154472 RepID=UPI0033B852F3
MTSPHDIDRLHRVRAVTTDLGDYKGLHLLVLGLFLVFLAFAAAGSGELIAPGVFLAAGLLLVVGRYYRERFGDVRPLNTAGRAVRRVLLPLLFLPLALVLITLSNVFGLTDGPISVAGFLSALLLALATGPRWRMRAHYPLAAAAMALASLLPLGVLTPSGTHPFLVDSPPMPLPLALGTVLCVCGLLDHRTLVRTLAPAPRTNETD